MVKLQIGENLINLTAKEEDLFFELLDKNYDIIRNSPTFNAVHNWMKEDSDLSKETVEDPWNHNNTTEEQKKLNGERCKKQHKTDDYARLCKMIDELLKAQDEKGYYIAL